MKIKFTVIGCGSIGQRHAAVIDADKNAELVALCDIDENKCRKISETYNQVPHFADYENMLKSVDADVVNICTPHGLHAPMSISAAKAKKHILVEKPMAISISYCENMIRAAKDNNV